MSPFSNLTQDHTLLSSETFEIIAESGKKRFFIHSDILAAQSEPLCSTVTEQRIDLSDWDGSTVGRFLQFLYVGGYQVPEPVLGGGEDGGDKGDEGESVRPDTPDTVQSLALRERWGAEDDGDANILLVHAKVYALAQHKDVGALRVMALERLMTALGEISADMFKGIARDVIELLDYIYYHTRPEEPIRDLVSTFAAENFEKLIGEWELGLLLRKGGDFPVELMEKVAGRFYGAGDELARVTRKLEVVEKELQESRSVVESGVEEKGVISSLAPSLNWLFKTEASVEARRKDLWKEPIFSVTGCAFSPYGLLCTAMISAVVIAVTLYIQYALRLDTVDGKSFEGICQYFEAHWWTGSKYVMVGEKPLQKACIEYIPGSRVRQPSLTVGGTMKDVCHFYEATSWVGSDTLSIGGKSLKEACISHYLI